MRRQSSTLLMSGDGKRGGAQASVLAPILDSTSVPTPWQREVGALPPAPPLAQRSAPARRSPAALYCAKPTWIVTVAYTVTVPV